MPETSRVNIERCQSLGWCQYIYSDQMVDVGPPTAYMALRLWAGLILKDVSNGGVPWCAVKDSVHEHLKEVNRNQGKGIPVLDKRT
jgi:Fe2+ or Zn2+ uptake regulation protein